MRTQYIIISGLENPGSRHISRPNVEVKSVTSTYHMIYDTLFPGSPYTFSINDERKEKPSNTGNDNSHYKIFAAAGARGGKKSRDYCKFRRTAIAKLIHDVLHRHPLDIPLHATYVANEIHDDFASIVRKDPARYGSIESFGAQDKTTTKPLLDFLIKTIRKLVRGGLKLVKSSAKEWYPAPGCVPA